MKKTKKILGFAIFAFTVTTITFYSCKKPKDEKSSGLINAQVNQPDLIIFNKAYQPSIYFTKMNGGMINKKVNSDVIYDFGKVQIELNDILSIYTDLKQNFGTIISNIDPKSIVLYANRPCGEIKMENIKGISFLSMSNGNLTHRLFQVSENSCIELNQFQYSFNGYDARDFSLLLDQVRNENDTYASYLMLTCAEFNTYTSSNSGPVFLTKNLIENQVMYRPVPKNQCETCEDDSETESCVKDHDGYIICSGGCMNKTINHLGEIYNQPVNLDIRKAYSFRDFLDQYKKGKEYILYYYKISYVVGGLSLINNENLADNIAFMTTIYNLSQRIQYGSDNEIIINNLLKDRLLEKLNSYNNVSGNREFNDILSKIKADIILYNNKTRGEILQDLN